MTNPNKIIYGGAFPEHPMRGDKSAKHPGTRTPYFGFRVVHDDADFREKRGRGWQSPVPRPEWRLDHPDETVDNLGFRLAWERS